MKNLSKFMSLVLRHRPESIGISLDPNGWTSVDSLINGINNDKINITRADIDEIVATDDKGRYSFSEDLMMIRANQGHSVEIDLQLKATVPPVILYHGTPERFTKIINKEGLKPMNRHHVHLSSDVDTAVRVGSRRGKAVVYLVDAKAMLADGTKFYRSENGVWLVDAVIPKYLTVSTRT